jgi:peptide subunit release factor 1 (eRF1)
MSVPSLLVNEHQRFTPEMRDKVLDKLGQSARATDDPTYRMLTPHHLRQLAQFESHAEPVISLYLQLTPDRRLHGAWRIVFKDLVAIALEQINGKRRRESLTGELHRIEDALQAELPALGRGIAFFTCRARGLWRQIALSLPLPDGVHIGSGPYFRPLARTRDEHDRFILAVLALDRSRFFMSQIGQVEEVFEVRGERAVPKPEATRNEARVLAAVTELVLDQFEGRHLLVSAAPELHAEFVDHLVTTAQQRLGGEFSVDVHAGPPAVAAAAEPAQLAIEEREEIATVQRLLDASPKYFAWGVPATLEALQERRVMVLAVDDAFSAPGARCGACKALLSAVVSKCPYCDSTKIEVVEDVVELAIEAALEQRAALEMVRSGRARQLMVQRGPMGALFRW